jgi:hypothetical protein
MHSKLTVAALLVAGHLSLPAVLIGQSKSRWTSRDVDAVVDLDERDPAAGAAVLAMLRANGATVTGIPGADPARLAALYERTRAVFGNEAEDLRLVAYVRWPRGTDVNAGMADLRSRPGVEKVDPWRQPQPAGDLPPNTAPNLALPLVGFQGYAYAARSSRSRRRADRTVRPARRCGSASSSWASTRRPRASPRRRAHHFTKTCRPRTSPSCSSPARR